MGILLAKNATDVKLADFGISKVLEATGHAHTLAGTPFYMAPEIVRGLPYGTASDVWAFGACMYELAALYKPFDAGNQLALARAIVENPVPTLPAATEPDIAEAIAGLLEKDPEGRWPLQKALYLISSPDTSICISRAEVVSAEWRASGTEEQLFNLLSPRKEAE